MSSGTVIPHEVVSEAHSPSCNTANTSSDDSSFAARHIGLSLSDEQFMLEAVSYTHLTLPTTD